MIILIADDDEDDLDFFVTAVAQINTEVKCLLASNGIEAIRTLETSVASPSYIFLDLNMPKMDGRQCLRHLKSSPVYNQIPVIIYSTSRRTEDIDEAIAAGAASFIVKPNKFDQLKEEIARAFADIPPALR